MKKSTPPAGKQKASAMGGAQPLRPSGDSAENLSSSLPAASSSGDATPSGEKAQPPPPAAADAKEQQRWAAFVNVIHRVLLALGLQNFGENGGCVVLSSNHLDLSKLVRRAIQDLASDKAACAPEIIKGLLVGGLVNNLVAYDRAPVGKKKPEALTWSKQGGCQVGHVDNLTGQVLKDEKCVPPGAHVVVMQGASAREVDFDAELRKHNNTPLRDVILIALRQYGASLDSSFWTDCSIAYRGAAPAEKAVAARRAELLKASATPVQSHKNAAADSSKKPMVSVKADRQPDGEQLSSTMASGRPDGKQKPTLAEGPSSGEKTHQKQGQPVGERAPTMTEGPSGEQKQGPLKEIQEGQSAMIRRAWMHSIIDHPMLNDTARARSVCDSLGASGVQMSIEAVRFHATHHVSPHVLQYVALSLPISTADVTKRPWIQSAHTDEHKKTSKRARELAKLTVEQHKPDLPMAGGGRLPHGLLERLRKKGHTLDSLADALRRDARDELGLATILHMLGVGTMGACLTVVGAARERVDVMCMYRSDTAAKKEITKSMSLEPLAASATPPPPPPPSTQLGSIAANTVGGVARQTD